MAVRGKQNKTGLPKFITEQKVSLGATETVVIGYRVRINKLNKVYKSMSKNFCAKQFGGSLEQALNAAVAHRDEGLKTI